MGILGELPSVSWGQIWAPVVEGVIVAALGYLGIVRTTSNKVKKADTKATEAAGSAAEATVAASLAKDYAIAMKAKDDTNNSLLDRVAVLEADKGRCEERCDKLEQKNREMDERILEMQESLRSASLLEQELKRHLEREHPADTTGSLPEASGSSSSASGSSS